MLLQYLVAGVVLIVTSLFIYFKWKFLHWKRKGVTYIPPCFPLGNISMKRGFNYLMQDAHQEFKSKGNKYGGIYLLHKPVLIVTEPDLIKRMMTTDFHHFVNHGNYVDEKKEPLSGNLLNLEDEKWKNLRAKLTSPFSSGKIKVMYEQFLISAEQMIEHINTLSSQGRALDIKEITSCYTTDIIGSCAFGVECNSFKNPNAEFRKYARAITDVSFGAAFRMFMTFIIPELKKVVPIRMFNKDVENFFTNAFQEVIRQRQTTDIKRNDFIQTLLEIGASHGDKSKGLTMEQMLAQSFIFFGAGLETSATNLTFCLYELSLNQEIQDKLRKEILEVLENHNGVITYDAFMDMKYMDQVMDESLRKYPPLPFLNRKCNADYPVPGSNFTIEKGTSVMVSVLGLQRDPEYFPDPEKFDPERFSKENKAKMHPFTFLPFGDGPRVCIGQRFAIIEIKVALTLILKNFKIFVDERTPTPLEMSPKNIVMVASKPILLKAEKI